MIELQFEERKGKERRNAQPLHLFTDCKQNHSEVNEKETEEMGGEVGKKNEAEVGDGQFLPGFRFEERSKDQ